MVGTGNMGDTLCKIPDSVLCYTPETNNNINVNYKWKIKKFVANLEILDEVETLSCVEVSLVHCFQEKQWLVFFFFFFPGHTFARDWQNFIILNELEFKHEILKHFCRG